MASDTHLTSLETNSPFPTLWQSSREAGRLRAEGTVHADVWVGRAHASGSAASLALPGTQSGLEVRPYAGL